MAEEFCALRGNRVGAYVQEALTQMNRYGDALLDMYQVLPPARRKRGMSGQSVTQAIRRNADEAEFIVKFYLDQKGLFEREENLSANPTFFNLLPPVRQREANGGARLRAPNGTVFPPFVILECGASLKDWCDAEPRTYAARLEALCAVADELRSLHEAGLAHLGLHPHNIIWLPLAQKWRAVDFGHAAQLGAHL
jgi:hypothetical protein